jgi:hypothetical protein
VIDQQSDYAEFTKALTVTGLIVGREIRQLDVREILGDYSDVIPIFFWAARSA